MCCCSNGCLVYRDRGAIIHTGMYWYLLLTEYIPCGPASPEALHAPQPLKFDQISTMGATPCSMYITARFHISDPFRENYCKTPSPDGTNCCLTIHNWHNPHTRPPRDASCRKSRPSSAELSLPRCPLNHICSAMEAIHIFCGNGVTWLFIDGFCPER